MKKQTIIRTGLMSSIGLTAFVCAAISPSAFGLGTNGNVQLNTEISASIAMKIVSPNDVNPNCTPEAGKTYGVVNRYASSTGDDSGKIVDTFNGNEGEADELNTNTSCATLSMTPNTFDSTYSDVTIFTNSPSGYALTVQSAEGATPALTNTTDNTQTIPAGILTEQDGTGEQAGQKIVPGGQNKWAYKTNNGIITDWTAMTASPAPIKTYDSYTEGGDTTRVTYGISTGSNPTGTYATELTYTATMFDGDNPYVSKINVSTGSNLTASTESLNIPFGHSASVTVTPASGYYLSGVTCPEGFTCSGYEIDINNTSAQTITIVNNNTNNTGILALSATEAIPVCSTSTAVGSTCYNTASDNTLMIKLADGHLWTKNSQGSTTWNSTLSGVSCPSGTSKPTAAVFQTLLKQYGGYNYSSYGSPYGTQSNTGALYNATGWSGVFWSTTSYDSSYAWSLLVNSSGAHVYGNNHGKFTSRQVVCYR